MTPRLPADWPRRLTVVLVYAALWVASGVGTAAYSGGTGISVWDLRGALDVGLFLVMGWRWWPLPVVLVVPCWLAAPDASRPVLLASIAGAIPYNLTFALAVKACRDWLRIRFPLLTWNDVCYFFLLFCVVAAPVANALRVLGASAGGARFNLWIQAEGGFVADATAIMVVVPVAMVLVRWNRALVPDEPEEERRVSRLALLQTAVLIAVVAAEYLLETRFGLPLVDVSFVPLAWMAVYRGVRGAALGVVANSATATAMQLLLHVPVGSQIEFDGSFSANALFALMLGIVSTRRSARLARVQRDAYYDRLTSLPNVFRLETALSEARGKAIALLLIDLSDIRRLYEALGRAYIDALVGEVARRLTQSTPANTTVARINELEFAVVVVGDDDAENEVQRVRELFAQPFTVSDSRVYVEPIIGAVGADAAGAPEEMLRRGRFALQRATASVHGTSTYDAGRDQAPRPIVTELHRALTREEFEPFFQPIYRYDDATGSWRPIGAEALLRWHHPERGLMLPADFIELLEHLSIGAEVGWKVLASSLRFARERQIDMPGFQVWVNLFARQVLDPDCAKTIVHCIEAAHVPARTLVVEITEKLTAGYDREVAALVSALRAAGTMSAIDDFGTGSSSLARLRDVPVQLLKIDRSFVSRCEIDDKAQAVTRTVAQLAETLGIETLAEGVESRAQADVMLRTGCRLAQGYLFAHPMPQNSFHVDVTAAR